MPGDDGWGNHAVMIGHAELEKLREKEKLLDWLADRMQNSFKNPDGKCWWSVPASVFSGIRTYNALEAISEAYEAWQAQRAIPAPDSPQAKGEASND